MISYRGGRAPIAVGGLIGALTLMSLSVALGQSLAFYGRRDYVSRETPQGIVSGDFNRDTFQDLAVANSNSRNLSIFLGNAMAGFSTPLTITVGNGPKALIAAQLNGDSNLDLAVANTLSSNISILLGQGTGGFTVGTSLSVQQPEALVAGDFTGDGIIDLVVASRGSNILTVFRGFGNGSFVALALTVPVGQRPRALAAGRLDAGNTLDLIVANYDSDTVTVLRGIGNGTFQPLQTIPVGDGPRCVVLANFDGDSNLDLAVANFESKEVAILRGAGNGTFSILHRLASFSRPAALVAADFNRDMRVDLAVMAVEDFDLREAPLSLVFLGGGDLTFSLSALLSAGFTSEGVVAVDFTRDGAPDLISTSAGGDTVSLWRGGGDGTFAAEPTSAPGALPVGVAAGDLNRDNVLDLVTTNYADENISVFLGVGDATFLPPVNYPLGPKGARLDPTAVVLALFNNDADLDIAVANAFDNSVAVLLNRGDGSFILPAVSYRVGIDPRSLAAADMDQNGTIDIVTANFAGNNVSVLKGLGDGTFMDAMHSLPDAMTNPRAIAIQDIDFDGCLDVVVGNFGTANASVLLGLCTGAFAPRLLYAATDGPHDGPHGIALADFNWDGYWDMAVSNAESGTISVWLGRTDVWGTFAPARTLRVGNGPTGLAAVDLNLDGYPDLVMTNSFSNNVGMLVGRGNGDFFSPEFFGVGAGPIFLTPGDFFMDGIPDVAAVNTFSSTLSILINLTFY